MLPLERRVPAARCVGAEPAQIIERDVQPLREGLRVIELRQRDVVKPQRCGVHLRGPKNPAPDDWRRTVRQRIGECLRAAQALGEFVDVQPLPGGLRERKDLCDEAAQPWW